ncbi:hypothetical protein B0H10DRAFT_1977031 [Mycena sp. CBHHK59/15]|nr:hypothetical protein B0H10DRAFT_1977031 [Mycena sp. CBHHK59/15]
MWIVSMLYSTKGRTIIYLQRLQWVVIRVDILARFHQAYGCRKSQQTQMKCIFASKITSIGMSKCTSASNSDSSLPTHHLVLAPCVHSHPQGLEKCLLAVSPLHTPHPCKRASSRLFLSSGMSGLRPHCALPQRTTRMPIVLFPP